MTIREQIEKYVKLHYGAVTTEKLKSAFPSVPVLLHVRKSPVLIHEAGVITYQPLTAERLEELFPKDYMQCRNMEQVIKSVIFWEGYTYKESIPFYLDWCKRKGILPSQKYLTSRDHFSFYQKIVNSFKAAM